MVRRSGSLLRPGGPLRWAIVLGAVLLIALSVGIIVADIWTDRRGFGATLLVVGIGTIWLVAT